jgi:hypothetical protein
MRNFVWTTVAALGIAGASCVEEQLPNDAGTDSGTCNMPIDCAAPPPDCHYEGGDFCTSCGTLVCEGAGPRTCVPGSEDCGPGYSCCYPCGIEGCEFQCEPTCTPGTPGCAGGCLLRP